MTEHPILFSGEMVRAILDGRKTQTRRVAKFIPLESGLNLQASSLGAGDYFTGAPETGKVLRSMGGSCWQDRTKPLRCPYGQPGDRLWVRETWIPVWHGSYEPMDGKPTEYCLIEYAASAHSGYHTAWDHYEGYWRPSIHMPRWASRVTLEVTGIRVERIQEISEADSLLEGVKALTGDFAGCFVVADVPGAMSGTTAKECFQRRWDLLNAKRGFGWDANPWVWVIEFKRIAQGTGKEAVA
jgi:hypothetical protein